MTTQTELAWLAGFADGEGSIQINYNRARDFYALRFTLTQKDQTVLINIQNQFGGVLAISGKGPHVWYRLVWSTRQAAELLRLLMPFLVVKRTQAELALRFQEVSGRQRKWARASPERRKMMRQMAEEMKDLRREQVVK